MFIQSGLGAYIGKVNMDINAPDYLLEDTSQSLKETEEILIEYGNKSQLVKPIISPRFVPACSPELMTGLGLLAEKYNAPVQSHLSEDRQEIQLVKEMYPNFPTYGNIYNYFGLFGQQPTVMAHCIFSATEEIELIKENSVVVAHCPSSNCHLGSGTMAVKKFLNAGVRVGLGSDISGGDTTSMLQVMAYAIAVSKMISMYSDNIFSPLTTSEAFFLGTKGGGSFFGKVGSFEEGYEFDALIIDDSNLNHLNYTLEERIQRLVYLSSNINIVERYVAGNRVDEPIFD